MPGAIGSFIARAAITVITGGAAGPLTFGLFVLRQAISFAVSALVTVGIGAAARAIAGGGQKSIGSSAPAFAEFAQNRTVTVRQPIARRRAAFGMVRLNGVWTFGDTTETSTLGSKSGKNRYFHRVVTTLGHSIKGAIEWLVDDDYVAVDSNGVVTSGKYKSNGSNKPLIIFEGTGTTAGDATMHSKLRANSSRWTVNHKQTGCAKFYNQFEFDHDVFTGAIPNVTAIAQTNNQIYDPRDGQTKYTNNAALCILHYILNNDFGIGDLLNRVNTASFISAANICEEQVPVEVTRTFTVDPASDEITLDTTSIGLKTGDKITIESTNTPPAPLEQATDYYWIRNTAGIGKIAASKDNALAGTAINLTNVGSGTHTLKRQGRSTFTADPANDVLTLPGIMMGLREGDGVEIETTGTAPGGSTASKLYYWVYVTHKSGKLAASYDNAMSGTAINITSAGTGTHTLIRKSEARYTLNGEFEYGDDPFEDLEDLLTSCGGFLTMPGGKWFIKVAAWSPPTVTLTQDEVDDNIEMTTQIPSSDKFNRGRGIFASPEDLYQPTDFPVVKNAAYEAEDGRVLSADFTFPYSVSTSACQRLVKIEIERARQQIGLKKSVNLFGLQLQPGSNYFFDYPRFGFSNKPFELKKFSFSSRGSEENPYLGCDLESRETAAAVFDWNSGEETAIDLAPNTNLPDSFQVEPPTNLALASGTAELLQAGDGTIISRIKAAFTEGNGAFITHTEFQFKKSADSQWINAPSVGRGIGETYLSPVQDDINYDVRARSVNASGVRSDKDEDTWSATVTNHKVIGKTENPSDVTVFAAQQNGDFATFKWNKVSDLDIAGYEIRYMKQGLTFDWNTANLVTQETKGNLITNSALPPGAWTLGIKAQDTSGNFSINPKTFNITVTTTNDVVLNRDEHPAWPGTLINFIIHEQSGKLIPRSQDTDSLADDVLAVFVPRPQSECIYETPELDLTYNAKGVRVWAEISGRLGPGETNGMVDPQLEIDFKSGGGSFRGFIPWAIGLLDAEFIKFRTKVDTGTGVAVLGKFTAVADVRDIIDSARGVAIPVGGKTISFNKIFHLIPRIETSVNSSTALFSTFDNVTTSSFKVFVFDSAGDDVGGTINWSATGA